MEVPDPRQVYNGAQRCGAVASDIEVVPDTADEVALPGSTMADRHAMSDDMDIEDAASRQSIEVNAVTRSCATGRGDNVSGHALVVTNEDAYQGVPVTSQQRYDPMRRSETSSRHSRPSDSEPLASQSGLMYRRRRRIHNSGMRGSGEQRRLFEDLRAELTEELRFQQAMFLNARDELAARQDEVSTQTQVAIEGLRGDMVTCCASSMSIDRCNLR